MADANFKPKTMKRKNKMGLKLDAPAPKPTPSAGDAQVPGGLADDGRADTLEIGVEFQLDLKAEDLIVLRELGSGNGGTVSKVIMARKVGAGNLCRRSCRIDVQLDYTCRGKERSTEAHRAGASHYA
jgi:hypothetical protein